MSQTYIVEPGDCMPSIARQFGFVNWKVIWDAPENDELRKIHPNPEMLAPGDEVVIPDKAAKEISVAKGASADTSLNPEKTLIRLAVYVDPENKAPPKAKWELLIEGAETPESGDLPADGTITTEVPATAEKAELRLFLTGGEEPDETYVLCFGELDPASTVAGAQERLRRLGYECGDIDGEFGIRTRSALLTFQEMNDLDPTGGIDQPTVNKLVDLFEGGGAYPEADPDLATGDIASSEEEGGVDDGLVASDEAGEGDSSSSSSSSSSGADGANGTDGAAKKKEEEDDEDLLTEILSFPAKVVKAVVDEINSLFGGGPKGPSTSL